MKPFPDKMTIIVSTSKTSSRQIIINMKGGDMVQNYISRGEVIPLTAGASYTSGTPYRISGFNGVALISVGMGEQLSFQLEGIFELTLADVVVGEEIFIGPDGIFIDSDLVQEHRKLFGRALTNSDSNNKFYCRLLQS